MRANPISQLAAILPWTGQCAQARTPHARHDTQAAKSNTETPAKQSPQKTPPHAGDAEGPRQAETHAPRNVPGRQPPRAGPPAWRKPPAKQLKNARPTTRNGSAMVPGAAAGKGLLALNTAIQKARPTTRNGPTAPPVVATGKEPLAVNRAIRSANAARPTTKAAVAAPSQGTISTADAAVKSAQSRPSAEKPASPTTNMAIVAKAARKGMTDTVEGKRPKTAGQAAGEIQTDRAKASGAPTAAKSALTTLRAAPAPETVRAGAETTGPTASQTANVWDGKEPTAVLPTTKRALAAFRKAEARGMTPSRGQAPTTTKGFSVERSTGGQIVVSREAGQGAAVVLPGGAVQDAAMVRSGAAHGGTGPAQTPQGPTGGEVADQLAESIRASGPPMGRQIVIRLHPPELGRVRIMFRSEGDAVRGVVRVDNAETLSKLEREAAPLMARLQGTGIEVRRLDVVLDNPHDGNATQNPAFREGRDQQGGWVGDDQSGASAGETLANSGQAVQEAEVADVAATDGSINVRI